jgi:hypothetical protein
LTGQQRNAALRRSGVVYDRNIIPRSSSTLAQMELFDFDTLILPTGRRAAKGRLGATA